MPGFGSGPFGTGPFGDFPWSKQVLFRDLPDIDRAVDANIAGQPLETTMEAFQYPFDELLRFAQNFGDLRDALRVRTQFNERITVNLLKAVPSGDGRTIEVLVDNPNPDDSFDPLFGTSVGWTLVGNEGREFTVNAVHKLRTEGPTIELAGAAESPATALSKASELTGTLEFTEGSATVTGVGTTFTTEVVAGQLVAPSGSFDFGFVDNVVDDFTLELSAPYEGTSTGPGKVSVVGTVSDGVAEVGPPSLIETFGEDFGIEVDRHEPEAFQRSAVLNVEQWLNLKGSQRSYDIIGKISGYRVVAYGLWRIGQVVPLTGTVTFTNGSTTVTGVGTAFTSEASIGQFIAPSVGIQSGTISLVVSDTSIELSAPYTGPSGMSPSAVVFDEPPPAGVDPTAIFQTASGKLYTTTDPSRPLFDELAADVIPLDMLCGETPNWTTDAITPPDPSPPDGTSVDEAIGWTVRNTPVISTTFLGDNRWRVRVGPTPLGIIASIGSWYAEFAGMPGERSYIETMPEEQFTALTGTLTVTNGSVAVTGVGTAFTSEVAPGDYVTLGVDKPRALVDSVTDDFNLVLVNPYEGTTEAGSASLGNEWEFEVLAFATSVFGATTDFGYECRPQSDCGFCRASVIRVEVVPVEVLSDPDALLDGVLLRLVTKIQQVVPAHVRLTDIVQILGPVQAVMDIQVQGAVSQQVSAFASAGFYFDIVPADELPLDQEHYVVTGSVSTVP